MYYATGLLGWMRFGYSPGWAGRSSTGLGPCASYFMTGQWPTKEQELAWLKSQADILSQQLEQLKIAQIV